MSHHPFISIVLCTWNRCDLLTGALDALTAQTDPPPHEILVVNNASTDATREVILGYVERYPQVRYVEEPRAGVSYARNAGVAAARGELIAFTDDDIRVEQDWVRTLAAAAESYPAAACFGGPVLPVWEGLVPRWLTRAHWAPLGIQDYDPKAFRVDRSRPVCLIGANLAVRRRTIEAIGLFDPMAQRVGNGIGSAEDHAYHVRLWDAGCHGVYHPGIRVSALVSPERLSKRYHRRWHFGHGVYLARMRLPELESSRWRMCDVPAHLLRQAAIDLKALVSGAVHLDEVASFASEVRLCFFAGFLRERVAATLARQKSAPLAHPVLPVTAASDSGVAGHDRL